MPPWIKDPHVGGITIPAKLREETERRILAHAEEHYAGLYSRIGVRFRGPFCYIDAYREPDPGQKPPRGSGESREQFLDRLRKTPTHLCRLRHCGNGRWSLAFYTYSHERYEPSFFASGSDYGSLEEGFDVGAVYLQG